MNKTAQGLYALFLLNLLDLIDDKTFDNAVAILLPKENR